MTWFLVVQIDVVCLLLIGFVMIKEYSDRILSAVSTDFRCLPILSIAFTLIDALLMLMTYRCIPVRLSALDLLAVWYRLTQTLIVVHWFTMVCRIYEAPDMRSPRTYLRYLPFLAYVILLVLSPVYGFIYRAAPTAEQILQHGSLYPVFLLVYYGYMAAAIGVFLKYKPARREWFSDTRTFCTLLFPIPILLFSLGQHFVPYISIAPVGVTLSVLLYYGEYRSGIASLDPLTGLNNRSYILSRFDEYVQRGKPFYGIMIDIDRFKHINDTYGHVTGDIVLARFGNVLHETAERFGYDAARYAGDEFLVAGLNGDENEVKAFIDAFEAALDGVRVSEAKNEHLTASMGLALFADGMTTAGLIEQADREMYRVKKQRKERGTDADRSDTAR